MARKQERVRFSLQTLNDRTPKRDLVIMALESEIWIEQDDFGPKLGHSLPAC